MKVREGQGEVKFTQAQIDKAEQVAKTRGTDAYLLLRLWGRRGLRVSETLRITKSDIKDKGVWIWQKGGERVLKILPPDLYEELSSYSKKLKSDLVFPITRQTAYNWSQSIAKEAGLDNWQRVHPHRWRHFFRDLPGSPDGAGPVESDEFDGSQGSQSISGVREQSKPRGGARGIVKLNERLRRLQIRSWFSSRSHLHSPVPGLRPSIDSRPDKTTILSVKPRRFWVLGVLAVLLFYHAYGILSGIYSDLTIVTYDQAIVLGVLEALIAPFLTIVFLWKTAVWQHDRPKSLKHVFDDPNILD